MVIALSYDYVFTAKEYKDSQLEVGYFTDEDVLQCLAKPPASIVGNVETTTHTCNGTEDGGFELSRVHKRRDQYNHV